MKTDIQIAQEAKMLHITEIAKKIDLKEDELEMYGKYKAKITDDFLNRMANKPDPYQHPERSASSMKLNPDE